MAEDLKATAKKNARTEASSAASSSVAPRRPSCRYGASCYRKNHHHLEDEAHPGDYDYKDPADEEDDVDDPEVDDRQECEYGTNCYRKNPQHRRDFKHTHKPNPRRRAKTKAAKVLDKDDEDGDYDSSFIDDDSVQDITDDEISEEEWVPSEDDD